MSTKNLLSNLKNNHRLIIVVILLIILVVLSHRYQRESFQEVNVNSLAKAGSVGPRGPRGPSGPVGPSGPAGTGSPGADGEDGATGAAGDSALKILQELEAPNDDDEKALYDAVFQHGSNATPEGDSAVNILKGLVDHIKQQVMSEIDAGVPVHAVIPFHINKDDQGMVAAYSAYVDTNSGPIVGGINDSLNILPFGFQVCNGKALQKIVTLENGNVDKAADDSGLNAPDYRGRFIIGGGRCAPNKNAGPHGDGSDTLYPNHYFYDQRHKGGVWKHQLSQAEMPSHNHDINMNLIWDWNDAPQNVPPQSNWRKRETHPQLGERSEFLNETPNFGGPGWSGDENLDGNAADLGRMLLIDHRGGNQPHNNMPPYAVVLYLIKVKDER